MKDAISSSQLHELTERVWSMVLGFRQAHAEAYAGEIRDALGELTNMVGGNFKTLLKGDCKLSVPSVLDTVRLAEVTPAPTEHLWFDCEGGMVLVNVAREQQNGVVP